MIDPFLLLAPIYLLGVMALLGFVGCFSKPPFIGDASKPFIISQTVMTRRRDSAWFGMTITVGPEPLSVRALGRFFVDGNSGTHRIRIVDAADSTDIAVGMVNFAGATRDPDEPYLYEYLTSPYKTLQPGAEYYVLSEESISGDEFYDQDTVVRPAAMMIPDAVVQSAVYSDAPGVYVRIPGVEHSYGPVNFRYVVELND